jgi:NADPH:quinone reductase-like Zn-dependent oxidoreductase
MKAIIQSSYGPPDEVLDLQDVDRPEIGDDEALVRVRASAVAGDDWHLMRGKPFAARLATGIRRPRNRIPGREVAGTVETVGKDVTRLRPGDDVFGWCDGAFAEYASVSGDTLAPKPANLTFQQAAVVPISAFTALQGLRDIGRIREGQKALIIGASGGVGTFAVQIGKALGAAVAGVSSTGNLDLVRSIGADRVVDYTKEDYTLTGEPYDVILDLVANRSLSDLRKALTPKGTLVTIGTTGGRSPIGRWLRGLALSPFVSQKLRPLIHKDSKEDLLFLRELIEAGKITPVISADYPLGEVPQAIRHFREGHARGKIAITV